MNSPITLTDVARQAGVSVATVSSVLNNTGRVSEGTRQRVLEVARDLGYVANLSARSLKGGRTGVLGMVVNDLASPVFAEIARGASMAARNIGLDLMLYTTSVTAQRERERVIGTVSSLCDGVLIVVSGDSDDYIRALEQPRFPAVLVNYLGETPLTTVGADNYWGARQATEHLAHLGHRRIGFITGASGSGQGPERLRGFLDALAAHGLPGGEDLIRTGDFTRPRGFAATRELLALPERPTAIFAANDESAFGAMDAAKDHGLRIPNDLSIVGFDDVPAAAVVHPALTTVRHPFLDIGATAVRLLQEAQQGGGASGQRVELMSELVVRHSTGPVGQEHQA